MRDPNKRCKQCRYWDWYNTECRLNPPVVLDRYEDDGTLIRRGVWPETFPDEWCGGWVDSKPQTFGGTEI